MQQHDTAPQLGAVGQQFQRPLGVPAGLADADEARHPARAQAADQREPGAEDQEMVLAALDRADEEGIGLAGTEAAQPFQRQRVGLGAVRHRVGVEAHHLHRQVQPRQQAVELCPPVAPRAFGIAQEAMGMHADRGEPAGIVAHHLFLAVLRHHQRHAVVQEGDVADAPVALRRAQAPEIVRQAPGVAQVHQQAAKGEEVARRLGQGLVHPFQRGDPGGVVGLGASVGGLDHPAQGGGGHGAPAGLPQVIGDIGDAGLRRVAAAQCGTDDAALDALDARGRALAAEIVEQVGDVEGDIQPRRTLGIRAGGRPRLGRRVPRAITGEIAINHRL